MSAGILEPDFDVRSPRSVAELVDIVSRLLTESADLPAPIALVSVFDTGRLAIQFESGPGSLGALTEWADRFNGDIRDEVATVAFGAYRACHVVFAYGGEQVDLYVHLSIDDPDDPIGR